MKLIQTILFLLIVKFSIAQIPIGTFSVVEMDARLYGSYFTIEFLRNNHFKLWSRECKSVDYGNGIFEISNDSIFFNFDKTNTSRTEVVKSELKSKSNDFVTLNFRLFSQMNHDSLDWFNVKIVGWNVDTSFTSLEYLSSIKVPKSQDTLNVQISAMGSYDKVNFIAVPNKSMLYSAWTTYYFNGFIIDQKWKYRLEKVNRNGFTISEENKKMKFIKTVANTK